MTITEVFAWILLIVGPLNVYFVWHGWHLYQLVAPRSPVLLALFGVKLVIWLMGMYIALVAFNVLTDRPAFPFGGVGLAIAILFVELLPLFVWVQMTRFVTGEQNRDKLRDEARDSGRDLVRDPARDEARDIEHDAEPTIEGP